MDGHGIPQVSPGATGVHLSWCGPSSWVYAPAGFTVQRRLADPASPRHCQRLDSAAIADLRAQRERRLSFGTVTLRDGTWLDDVDGDGGEGAHTPTEVFRFDLDDEHRVASVVVTAKLSYVVALHGTRVVGASGPTTGTATHLVRAPRLDAVVAYTLSPDGLQVCVDIVDPAKEEELWRDVPPIVSGLTMPFRELMPSLADDADELAEARDRLVPGETIEEESFARLSTAVRPLLRAMSEPAPPRPADLALLLREHTADDPDEARALDPVRLMLAHPTWRRALGFAWFDDDPELVVGETYDYRITATYPSRDVRDHHHAFATVPSGTLLPADFALGGPRFRVPRPVTVVLAGAGSGRAETTRRGIRLDPTREPHWLGPGLDDWSLVVDFPAPVEEVVLDLEDGHELVFSAGSAFDPFDLTDPVPAGPRPRLDLGGPAQQLRLRGTGLLHGIRLPTSSEEKVQLSVVLPPITLADTPLPDAPLSVSATSLQQPTPLPAGPAPDADVPHRHALGFTVGWRPAPAFGITAWPPDLDASVPLDATVFEVERTPVEAGGSPPAWEPVVPEQNWTLGDRGGQLRDLTLSPGTDLMAAFPEQALRTTGADLDLSLVDTLTDPDTPPADGPRPGAFYRYRVRAVDAVGRPSPSWRETDPVRLEKHVPPPLPVGPSGAASPDQPSGVQVRTLVRDAEDLTDDERALLGSDGTAVLLRWGWHEEQRAQDPFATEFRVYAAPPLDVVRGTVTSVTTTGVGRVTSYRLALALDRHVPADLAAGLRLDAGHPFFIRAHTAGTTMSMDVETRLRVRGNAPVPALGPVSLRVPLTPDRTRPPAWGTREAIVPVTAAAAYEVVLRGRLVVSADGPVDTLWVGVSTADDQAYVDDQLAPAETRPGNESAVVPVLSTARYAGRPALEVPPLLAPVPVVLTPEPGGEPVRFRLDLTAFLPAEALASPGLRTERVAANTVVAACATTSDGRVLGRPVDPRAPGDADLEIEIPNPDDRAALVAALEAGSSAGVEDRFVVFLAGHHPYRERLFEPADDGPAAPGPVPVTLPSLAQRWAFRVRAADAAGHLSAGGATAAVVVRVPSLAPPPPPTRLPPEAGDHPSLLRFRVSADGGLTHLLVFTAPSTGVGAVAAAELLRVPNRADLHPTGHLWLRSHDGVLLSPAATALDDPSVAVGADGTRTVPVSVPGDPGERTRVWLTTLNRDGVPSEVTGPYTVQLPPPPLPVPTLTFTGDQAAWTWAAGVVPSGRLLLAVERLRDEVPAWQRVSPMVDPAAGSTHVDDASGTFRLRVSSPDGRSAHSEPVTV